MLSPRFARQVSLNVRYWQQRTAVVDDRLLGRLDGERENLFRAVSYGLGLEATQRETAELVLQLAPLAEKRGYWDEWIGVLQRAVRVAAGVSPLRVALLNQMGLLHRLRREIQQAIGIHRQALAEAQAAGPAVLTDSTYFHLGTCFMEIRDYDTARLYANRALVQFLARPGDAPDDKIGPAYNLLGLIALHTGDGETAVSRFRQAITHWARCGDTTYLARAWNNLGMAQAGGQDWQAALASYDQADAILATTMSELDRVRVAINRGNVHYRMGNLADAAAAYRAANTPYLQQSADRFHQALIASNLGYVLTLLDELDEAHGWLRRGVALWREQDDALMLASALLNTGLLAWRRGEETAAAAAYDEAEPLLLQHQDDAWGREMLAELADRRQKLAGEPAARRLAARRSATRRSADRRPAV